MKYISYLFLCVAILVSSLHAEIVVQDGTLDDWDACCEIARTMHIPLIQELNKTLNSFVTHIFGLSNPEKHMTKLLNLAKKEIFTEKATKLFVLHEHDSVNNTFKVIGFFSFTINNADNSIAHTSRYGYIEQEISPEAFSTACKEYFLTHEKYKNIKCLLSVDAYPSAQGEIINKYRARTESFGFKKCQHPRGLDHFPFLMKIPAEYLFGAQVYILDLEALKE